VRNTPTYVSVVLGECTRERMTMNQTHDIKARDRRRQERRIWRSGLLISVLIHLFLFFGWKGNVIPVSPFAAAGPRAGDNRAAKGSLQALNIRTPPPVPIVRPPIPIPTDIAIEPLEFDDMSETDPASALGEEPGMDEEGPGLEDGTGEGDGGTADEGFYRLQPPTPRGMIIPPYDRGLRGTEVQVWVFVTETGLVVADSTRLEPPTRDRDFNRRLISQAAEWRFRPAIQEGKAVSSWFPYRIKVGNE
jgi:hypothetical protein